MASYIEEALAPGEKILHRAHVSWFYSPWATIILLLLSLPTLGISLFLLIPTWITVSTTEMAVTSRRIMIKRGLISRNTVEISLARIESVQVNQSIMARLFNFGTVVLSGAGNPQAPLIGIKEPLAFRSAVLLALDESAPGDRDPPARVVHIPVPPLPYKPRTENVKEGGEHAP